MSYLYPITRCIRYAALNMRPGCKGFSTDVCVPMSNLSEMVQFAQSQIKEMGLVAPIVGHVGDGNFHCLVVVDESKGEVLKAVDLGHRLAKSVDRSCDAVLSHFVVLYIQKSLCLMYVYC